jgi:hypothetical protein
MATLKETPPPLPSEPKIMMSTIGKNRLKNVEEGLLKIDLKLAFVIANKALRWLYGWAILFN